MIDVESRPCWIIDVLPKQVPDDSPGRYFTVEKYFLSHLEEIAGKFASMLVKLNCFHSLTVSPDDERWFGDFSPEDLVCFLRESISSHSPVFIRIQPSDALVSFSGDDHYMTLYGPDEELLELVRQLASAEGLFVWTPIN